MPRPLLLLAALLVALLCGAVLLRGMAMQGKAGGVPHFAGSAQASDRGAREVTASAAGDAAQPPESPRKDAWKRATVELFSAPWCPNCKKARAWLQRNAVPFREYDVDHDLSARKRWKQLTPERNVPVLLVNGQTFIGFSPPLIRAALNAGP